jgi:hypothetical protein
MSAVRASAARIGSAGRRVHVLPALGLVAALGAATALTTDSLGRRPFWADETFSVEAARLPLGVLVHYISHVELNMALYDLLLHGWLLLGRGEAFARTLSVVFAVATIPVVYAVARRLFDARTAAVAVLLLAVDVAFVGYAREARSYSLALLLVSAATLFLVRAVQDGHRCDWTLFAVATALAVYAHLFAALVLPAQLVSLLALGREAPWRRAVVASAGACLLLAPGTAAVVLSRQGGQIDWLTAPHARQLPGLILSFTGSRALLVLFFLAVVSALLRGYRVWRSRGPSQEAWPYALLLAWLVLPAATAFVISFAKPVFLYRYFLPSLPALVLLAAAGIVYLGRVWLVVPAVLVAATISTRNVVRCLPDCMIRYDDWRGAASYVAPRVQAGDAVLFDPRDVKTPFVHYLGHPRRLALLYPSSWRLSGGPAPGAPTLAAAVSRAPRYRRVWLVTWWLPEGTVPAQLERAFRLQLVRHFAGNVRVRLYERRARN